MKSKLKSKLLLVVSCLLLLSSFVLADNILILGDSHYAGTYGHELDTLLKQAGNTVESYGCVSASPIWYTEGKNQCQKLVGSTISGTITEYPTPSINTLLQKKYNLVLISLGGNLEASTTSKDARVTQISNLIKPIASKNIKCIWIGPPGKNDPTESISRDTFYTQLQEALQNQCQLIDSRPYAKLNKNEIHFTDQQRPTNWAHSVYDQLLPLITFTGPPLSAMETDDETKIYAQFESEPQIIEDTSLPQETNTLGFQPGVTQASSQTTQKAYCNDIPRCQQLDEVWTKRIGSLINPQHAQQIWNTAQQSWTTFEEVYNPLPNSFAQSFPTTTTLPIPEELLTKKVQQDLENNKYNQAFLTKVNTISSELNINPAHLIAVMRFESGFKPCAKNKLSGATGLIQFLESTAKKLKTTTKELCDMTRLKQLDYVEKYFLIFKHKLRPNNFGDVAMAVFWPRAIGKEDSYVLFNQGTKAYTGNAALDRDHDGSITRVEYINFVIKRSQ